MSYPKKIQVISARPMKLRGYPPIPRCSQDVKEELAESEKEQKRTAQCEW